MSESISEKENKNMSENMSEKFVGSESEPDENGIITKIEYKKDNDGNMIKIIKKIKRTIIRKYVNKNILERKNKWVKFGLAATEPSVTYVSNEDVFMEPPPELKPKNIVDMEFPTPTAAPVHAFIPSVHADKPDNKFEKNDKRGGFDRHRTFDDKFNEERKEKYKKDCVNLLKITNIGYDLTPADFYDLFNPANIRFIHVNNGMAIIKFTDMTEAIKLVEFSKKYKFGYKSQLLNFQIS